MDNTEESTVPPTESEVTASAPPLLPHLQQEQQMQHMQSLHAQEINYEEEAQKLEDRALRFLAKQAHPVIVPSFASWFDFSEIHEIEKRSLPDFFDDSSRFKTAKSYKDARNFMINTYRLSPYEYLTMTAVRRNIAMDVASIMKIHSFLEKWGLINYQIDPRSKPSLIGPTFTGHFQVILDTPQGLKPFVPTKIIKEEGGGEEEEEEEGDKEVTEQIVKPNPFPVNLSLRRNIYDSISDFNALQSRDKSSRQIQKTYVCHTCGNDAVMIRYHNLRAKDANLCSRCFQEGHFGANFQASDFIKLENNYHSAKKFWSDQEILLLLEGIEMYEDHWDKIVSHVGGNKTIEDCVQKFLSLPIEDRYISDIMEHKGTKLQESNGGKSTNETSTDIVSAVDSTIKSLLDGLHKEILEEKVPESAKNLSAKYLQESQAVIQELADLTIQKLTLKFDKLATMEKTLELERTKYIKESETLLNDRMMLSKQVKDINKELSSLNVSKQLILLSDQMETKLELTEKEDAAATAMAAAFNNEQLQKKSEQVLESLSHAEPQIYKPWSL